ncbi:MAG: LytTR family transcriptional regulator, partial [Pseudomonadota bacterium]|nr:LytTR family transcriptional regulator [Pseudomonadota bacterium]
IAALASSEVRWNGRLIGRNGVPAANAGRELPGRYFAVFTVPSELVRPGNNRVSVRMSAGHLWLPVRRPIHLLTIGPYETPQLPGRALYLPAFLAIGALVGAFAYFTTASLGGARRRERGPLLLAGIAGTALVQLLLEVSRAFLVYSYPWHLARVSAIAATAAITAVLVAAYAADRFAPALRRMLPLSTAGVAAASVVFLPMFDLKALVAILAGTIALGIAAVRGIRRGLPGAHVAGAVGITAVLLMPWRTPAFLDQTYYLLLAAVLVMLVAEQVGQLRAARAGARRAAALEERLQRAEAAGEPIVALKNGTRVHRVAAADILFARAADDYCEVRMRDGRELLVTTNLAKLVAGLSDSFVRVHRSFVVNRDRVELIERRSGGGRKLVLQGGVEVPVGRRFAADVEVWATKELFGQSTRQKGGEASEVCVLASRGGARTHA